MHSLQIKQKQIKLTQQTVLTISHQTIILFNKMGLSAATHKKMFSFVLQEDLRRLL